MAAKKQAPKTPVAPEAPKPTAASKEKDKEEQPHTVRVDLGESLPTPPIKTATDND
jgi:hypothetical protein